MSKCDAAVYVDTGRPDKKDGVTISCEGECDGGAMCRRHTVEKKEALAELLRPGAAARNQKRRRRRVTSYFARSSKVMTL